MSNQARRYLIGTSTVLIGWYLCVMFLWALKPLTDSVPIASLKDTNPSGSQQVKCNTLFAGAVRGDAPLPTLQKSARYTRTPCVVVHSHARVVLAVDTLVLLLLLGAIVVVAVRLRADGTSEPLSGATPALA